MLGFSVLGRWVLGQAEPSAIAHAGSSRLSAAVGILPIVAVVAKPGSARLDVSGNLSVITKLFVAGGATLAAASGLSVNTNVCIPAGAFLAASGKLVAIGSLALPISALLVGDGRKTANAIRQTPGSARLATNINLFAELGAAILPTQAGLAASGRLTAEAWQRLVASGRLTLQSGLTVDVIYANQIPARAALTATAGLAVSTIQFVPIQISARLAPSAGLRVPAVLTFQLVPLQSSVRFALNIDVTALPTGKQPDIVVRLSASLVQAARATQFWGTSSRLVPSSDLDVVGSIPQFISALLEASGTLGVPALTPEWTGELLYGTLSPTDKHPALTLAYGNTAAIGGVSGEIQTVRTRFGKHSGKWYWEVTLKNIDVTSGILNYIGVQDSNLPVNAIIGTAGLVGYSYGRDVVTAEYHALGYTSATGPTEPLINEGIYAFALDLDANKLWLRFPNGVWANSGDPALGLNPVMTWDGNVELFPACSIYRSVGSPAVTDVFNFGQSDFTMVTPAGFSAGWYEHLGPEQATLNPADKSPEIVLTNYDQTAEGTSLGIHQLVRATQGKAVGKWYWEATITGITDGCFIHVGVQDGFTPTDKIVGESGIGFGWGYDVDNSATYRSGAWSYVNVGLPLPEGTIGFAVDFGRPIGDLAAYWSLGNRSIDWATSQVIDGSGSGYTGTLIGINSSAQVAGRIGQALHFGAGRVDFGNVLHPAGAFTYSAWIRQTDTASPYVPMIMGRYDEGAGNIEVWFGFDAHDGSLLSAYLYTSAAPNNLIGRNYAGTIPFNTWHHVVLTYDGGKTSSAIKLYVDGVNVTTADASTGIFTGVVSTSAHFTIGSDVGQIYPFPGDIDDVRVFNRALTATEITSLLQHNKLWVRGDDGVWINGGNPETGANPAMTWPGDLPIFPAVSFAINAGTTVEFNFGRSASNFIPVPLGYNWGWYEQAYGDARLGAATGVRAEAYLAKYAMSARFQAVGGVRAELL